MKIVRSILAAIVLATWVAPAIAQQPTTPSQSQPRTGEQQREFIPIEQLPPQEQLPAARLLVVAYCFVLAALFVYVASVSRRLGSVRREVQRLEADLKRSGRA